VTVIQTDTNSFGSTSLVQAGSNYFVYAAGTSSAPELSISGVRVTAGQFGSWTPIGAEQTASGYDVACKMTGVDQYAVWATDSSGSYLSNVVGVGSGSSSAFESLESIFHQDLNEGGVIGLNLPTTVIGSFGSTSLTEVGSQYYLNNSSGSGPALQFGGVDFVAGSGSATMGTGANAIFGATNDTIALQSLAVTQYPRS
jgi:serralysin